MSEYRMMYAVVAYDVDENNRIKEYICKDAFNQPFVLAIADVRNFVRDKGLPVNAILRKDGYFRRKNKQCKIERVVKNT